MSLFKIPSTIASSIEKMMRNFFWQGMEDSKGSHLLRWKVLRKPIDQGGLEIGKVKERNKALVSKWFWRFPRERSSLWAKVVSSIHGIAENQWNAGIFYRVSYRSPWKFIHSNLPSFQDHIYIRVGNGSSIRFWEDKWIGDQPLAIVFPELYRVSSGKHLFISSFLESPPSLSSNGRMWNLYLPSRLSPSLRYLKGSILSLLEVTRFLLNVPDKRMCTLSQSGHLSCKSFHKALIVDPVSSQHQAFKGIWKALVPTKVKVFGWLVLHKSLNTQDRLQRRFPFMCISPHCCPFCIKKGKGVEHLLFKCAFARDVWWKWNIWSRGQVRNPTSIPRLKLALERLCGKSRKVHVSAIGVLAVIWILWQERNNCIFDDKHKDLELVWEESKFLAARCVAISRFASGYSYADWARNWSVLMR